MVFLYIMGAYKKDGKILLLRPERTRDSGFKPEEDEFRLDTRKKFFRVRIRHRNKLPREVVDSP